MRSAGDVLADRRRRAEERLDAAAGDVTLCVIGRSGERFPGVKYHEGAAAALMEVGRRAKHTAIESAIEAASIEWSTALTDALDRLGTDWIAYRQGGVDELEGLARELGAVRASPEPGVTQRRSGAPTDPGGPVG